MTDQMKRIWWLILALLAMGLLTLVAPAQVVIDGGVVLGGTSAGNYATLGANTFTGIQTVPNLIDTGLTIGDCVQVGSGGLLTTTGAACGSGGGTGFPITLGSTSIAGSSTTTTIAGIISLGSKVIDGVSYSFLYSGSTVDARVNACLSDALNLANGNVTKICDATAETGRLNTTSQITVGDTSGDFVLLRVPCSGYWIGTMTDGTSATVFQYGGSEIDGCPVAALGGNFGFTAGPSSNLGTVMTIMGSSYQYIVDKGFDVVNISGGHATASGTGLLVNGTSTTFADGSNFQSVNVRDGLDTRAAVIEDVCCAFSWNYSGISGNGTAIPLSILNSGSGFIQGLTFNSTTIVGQEPGQPGIACTDTSTGHISDISFDHVYGESSDTTTTYIQIAGCQKVRITDFEITANASGSTAPLVSTSNAYNTDLMIDGMHAYSGAGSYTYPIVAVCNNFTAECGSGALKTDANGNFGHYEIPGHPFTFGTGGVKQLTVGGAPVIPGVAGYPLVVENNAASFNGNIEMLNTSKSSSNYRTTLFFDTYLSGTASHLFELGSDAELNGTQDLYLYDDVTARNVFRVLPSTDNVAFTVAPYLPITGSTQCLQVSSTGLVSGTGSACGSGGGGGGITNGTLGFFGTFGSATTINATAPLDYNITNSGQITSTVPIAVTGPTTGIHGGGTQTYTAGGSTIIGTSPSAIVCVASVQCDSFGGSISFTTGSSVSAAGVIFTITMPQTRTNVPSCVTNIKGGTVALDPWVTATVSSSIVTLSVGTNVALASSTAYQVNLGVCNGN